MTTQFGDKYHKWAQTTKATMRIRHKPGDAMEVDWAGQTLPLYDSVTGAVTAAHLFVAVLPCSGYTYAEVTADMTLKNWLGCHIHAYEYFGGVTRLLIPDNLKTGVTKNTRYETVLNRSYQELAEYYGTAIVPARVERPRDKSHAEGTVKFASTWILAALRNEHFFTLREAKEAVKIKLEELNLRDFTAKDGCRRSAYLKEEQAFMRPLPNQRCSRCDDTYTDSKTNALGHTPGAEADCLNDQICTVCGVVLTEKLGHDYKAVVTDPTCTEEGYTTHTCSRCADAFTDGTTAPIGHDESDWIVDQDSAPGVEGSKHTECTVCGVMMETSVIEALPEETESESQQDTEEISDTDTDMETVTDTDEESTTAQGTEKAPSGGGCSGSIQGISMLLLFMFAAMIPVFKRKKENG